MSFTSTPADADAGGALQELLLENHREFLGFLERRLNDRALAEDIGSGDVALRNDSVAL